MDHPGCQGSVYRAIHPLIPGVRICLAHRYLESIEASRVKHTNCGELVALGTGSGIKGERSSRGWKRS